MINFWMVGLHFLFYFLALSCSIISRVPTFSRIDFEMVSLCLYFLFYSMSLACISSSSLSLGSSSSYSLLFFLYSLYFRSLYLFYSSFTFTINSCFFFYFWHSSNRLFNSYICYFNILIVSFSELFSSLWAYASPYADYSCRMGFL